MISRDPLSRPEPTTEILQLAQRRGQNIVHISLTYLPTVADPAIHGKSFLALMDFLPRIGELIQTQNNKLCKVVRVLHVVTPIVPVEDAFSLIPTVFAVLDDGTEPG